MELGRQAQAPKWNRAPRQFGRGRPGLRCALGCSRHTRTGGHVRERMFVWGLRSACLSMPIWTVFSFFVYPIWFSIIASLINAGWFFPARWFIARMTKLSYRMSTSTYLFSSFEKLLISIACGKINPEASLPSSMSFVADEGEVAAPRLSRSLTY